MTQEQLSKAKELQQNISELKQHLIYAKDEKKTTFEVGYPNSVNHQTVLKKDLMPISSEIFMKLYRINVEIKIAQLEKQFDNL